MRTTLALSANRKQKIAPSLLERDFFVADVGARQRDEISE